MGLLSSFTTKNPGDVITSTLWNNNFAAIVTWAGSYVVHTDVAKTITVTHIYTQTQTFTGGWTAGAAVTVSTGGLTVTAGGLTVSSGTTAVQALTATTGTFSGAVTANTLTITGGDIQSSHAGPATLETTGAYDLRLGTDSAWRWAVTSVGNFIASTDNAYDVGASGASRPRTIYAGTSVVVPTITATTGTFTGIVTTSRVDGTAGGDLILSGLGSQGIVFGSDDTTRFYLHPNGTLLAQTDNANDIGASGTSRIRTLYAGTSVVVPTVTATNLAGTLTTAAQPNITSVGTLTSLTTGAIVVTNVVASVSGNCWVGPQTALATNATTGHLIIGTCNGTPTGTPAGLSGNNGVAILYDYGAAKIWVHHSGTWRQTAALTS